MLFILYIVFHFFRISDTIEWYLVTLIPFNLFELKSVSAVGRILLWGEGGSIGKIIKKSPFFPGSIYFSIVFLGFWL